VQSWFFEAKKSKLRMRGILRKAFLVWELRVYRRTLSRVIKAREVPSGLTGYKTSIRIYVKRLFGKGGVYKYPPKIIQYAKGGYFGYSEPGCDSHNMLGFLWWYSGLWKVTPVWKNQRFSYKCLENSLGISHTSHNPYS